MVVYIFPIRHNRSGKCYMVLILSLKIVFLSSCTTQNTNQVIERPVGQLYNEAMNFLELGEPQKAARIFLEVDRQHPHSIWATKAQLMAAYAFYEGGKYDDAVTALERFILLHPDHRDTAYAYYIKGLCHYERLADVALDQKNALLAADSLRDLMLRFPYSLYARDSHSKLDIVIDHLAGKEMSIGRFYLQFRRYPAAINRFKKVVFTYQTTAYTPEALHRLVESYTALGLLNEARKVVAILGFNFPGSLWYQDSYDLIHRHVESLCLKRENNTV